SNLDRRMSFGPLARNSLCRLCETASSRPILGGVVAFAGEHLQIFVRGFHFDLAERAVVRGIGRIISNRIFRPKFFGDLIKSLLEVLLGRNFDDPAAGGVGNFVPDVGAPAVAGIVHQQNVHDGVGTLRGFDGFFHSDSTALVVGVGDDYERFAAGFGGQFFSASNPNRVVKSGTAQTASARFRRQRTRVGHGHHRSVDAGASNGPVELRAIFGEIGEKVHVDVERNHHGFVALAQNAVQEARGRFLLGGQAILFAAAGVNQQPKRDRKRFFGREKGNLLLLIVFKNPEVFLFERGDDVFVFVAHGGENVDQANFGFDGGNLLVVLLPGRLAGLLGRVLRPSGSGQRACNPRCETRRHNFGYRTHVYFPCYKSCPAKRARDVATFPLDAT